MRRLRIVKGVSAKKILQPKIVVLGLIILITLIVVGIAIYKTKSAKPTTAPVALSCSEVIESAKSSLLKNQKQQAYDVLKKYTEKCANNSDTSVQAKIGKLSYNSALAEAAYASGDKELAYKYTNVAVEVHKSIPQTDRRNIENLSQIENNLLNILSQQETNKNTGVPTQ